MEARIVDACEKGTSEFKPDVVKTDNQCAFGKWLYGTISSQEKLSPYYAQVKDLHAQFHEEAGRILEMALSGRTVEAKKSIEMGSKYITVSGKLVTTLMKWGNS